MYAQVELYCAHIERTRNGEEGEGEYVSPLPLLHTRTRKIGLRMARWPNEKADTHLCLLLRDSSYIISGTIPLNVGRLACSYAVFHPS